MKAIAIVPGITGASLIDIEEPQLQTPDDVKIRVHQVGICGTDREEMSGGRATAPPGKKQLVIGHEMLGQVVEVGASVRSVKKGDWGVFMVRRGCGKCEACKQGRSDLCYTGDYTERGIKGADGFQSQFVVDKEKFLVPVPENIREIGVLTEPMSVAAKAIDEALIIQQARFRDFIKNDAWLQGKKALIAGIGPIGLMAAFALRLKGAEVVGLDIVDEKTLRPSILKKLGGTYVDGRNLDAMNLDDVIGESDFIFEATGIAKMQLQLIDALAINGIYVATGIPSGDRPLTIAAASLMQQLVLKNQVMLGSVNASIQHYHAAVDYLAASFEKWPEEISRIITTRIPFTDFNKVIHDHTADEIKVVVEWS